MPSIQTLKQINAISGLFFGCFLVLHLLNHYALNLGWETALFYQQKFKAVYQNPLFEILLFGSLVAHMYANFMIYTARSKVSASKNRGDPNVSPELVAHRNAGYFVAASMFGHVAATRLGPIILLGDEASEYDYSFVAKVNENLPSHFFLLYLLGLGVAGGWHLIYGTRSALATLRGSSVTGIEFPYPLKLLAYINHILIFSACLALAGVFYDVDTTTKDSLHYKLFHMMGI